MSPRSPKSQRSTKEVSSTRNQQRALHKRSSKPRVESLGLRECVVSTPPVPTSPPQGITTILSVRPRTCDGTESKTRALSPSVEKGCSKRNKVIRAYKIQKQLYAMGIDHVAQQAVASMEITEFYQPTPTFDETDHPGKVDYYYSMNRFLEVDPVQGADALFARLAGLAILEDVPLPPRSDSEEANGSEARESLEEDEDEDEELGGQ